MPTLSVALPVFNAEATLAETLESLVRQSLREFEVVLLDDASSDRSLDVASAFESRLRLRLLRSETNLGISGARNRLLSEISSDYVAILDHDDICHHDRLARQLHFLQSRPEIDIVGSAIGCFTDSATLPGSAKTLRLPLEDAAIRTRLLHRSALAHPAAMAKRSFFTDCGGYEPSFSPAEDYALWCRAALLGKQFANLDDTLLFYRDHPRQTSHQQRHKMALADIAIKRFYIQALMGGETDGRLAELLCPYARLRTRALLAGMLPEIVPVILQLARRAPCLDTYGKVISEALSTQIQALD